MPHYKARKPSRSKVSKTHPHQQSNSFQTPLYKPKIQTYYINPLALSSLYNLRPQSSISYSTPFKNNLQHVQRPLRGIFLLFGHIRSFRISRFNLRTTNTRDHFRSYHSTSRNDWRMFPAIVIYSSVRIEMAISMASPIRWNEYLR
jgi:hypothetical protein